MQKNKSSHISMIAEEPFCVEKKRNVNSTIGKGALLMRLNIIILLVNIYRGSPKKVSRDPGFGFKPNRGRDSGFY